MTAPVPGPPSLRATVIMDYQNVHLTGHEVFGKPKHLEKHETLIDPPLYAQQLLRVRNAKQRPGYSSAVLGRVLVYRGQPSDEHDPDRQQGGLRREGAGRVGRGVLLVGRRPVRGAGRVANGRAAGVRICRRPGLLIDRNPGGRRGQPGNSRPASAPHQADPVFDREEQPAVVGPSEEASPAAASAP
jgi:hypothetical protein